MLLNITLCFVIRVWLGLIENCRQPAASKWIIELTFLVARYLPLILTNSFSVRPCIMSIRLVRRRVIIFICWFTIIRQAGGCSRRLWVDIMGLISRIDRHVIHEIIGTFIYASFRRNVANGYFWIICHAFRFEFVVDYFVFGRADSVLRQRSLQGVILSVHVNFGKIVDNISLF